MKSRLWLGLGALVAACNSGGSGDDGGVDATPDSAQGTEAGAEASAPEASAPDAASEAAADAASEAAVDAGPSTIRVRVAHLSPNAPPVDFCVRPMGGTFTGAPVLRGLSVSAGLAYSQVTEYLSLPPGQYQVRLVAPNSADCNTSLGGLPEFNLPALAAGATATVGATGLLGATGAAAFALTPFVDDATAPAAGNVRVRFAHASAGTPAVDVGLLAAATNTFTPLFSNVAFGAQAPEVRTAAPAGPVSVAVRLTGSTPAAGAYPLRLDNVTLPAGGELSVYAIGRVANDPEPLAALVCNDAMTANHLTACAALPAKAYVRVAHLAPGAPAVDLCLRPTSAADSAFQGPLLAGRGLTTGLPFANVTQYVALDPGAYTVRLVAPGSANCNTPLAGLPNYDLPNLAAGTWATSAAVGLVGGTPAFTVRAYVDTHAASTTQARARFVHASPGTPAVDVGVVSGASFTAVWSNTAFPNAAAGAPNTDANGFTSLDPVSNATLAVRATGSAANALTLPMVSLPAGSVSSVFAIGRLGMSTGDQRLSALVCNDRGAVVGGASPCARLP